MQIKIPVLHNVEVVIADVYVKVGIQIQPICPIKTAEGELAIDSLKIKLTHLGYEMANQIMEKLEESIRKEDK